MRFGHKHSRDGVDHVQTHLHAAVSVIRLGLRQAGHTVVAVAQNLDPPTVILLQMNTAGGKALQLHFYMKNRACCTPQASENMRTVTVDLM